MMEPQRKAGSKPSVRDKRSREKPRSLKDTLLISAWVAAYGGVLVAFRVARALEGLLSSKQVGT